MGDRDQASGGRFDGQLPAGQEVGEYVVEERIGAGGFGTVYRAVHPVIGKRVAIKVLAWRFAADEAMVSRFSAEARAVNQIGHRNIIDIFSFSRLPDGRHYYVMEYLDGEPLDHYIADRALPFDEAITILRTIARALDAAHACGIVHRDLKPENIFLARDAEGGHFPKLLDFGIAKLLDPEQQGKHKTTTGMPIGTPAYMSPEQCRGLEVDHRSDIYSFGVVAYRLLAGRLPFAGNQGMDLMLKHMNDEPPKASTFNPELSRTVDRALAWLLRKEPSERPPSVFAGAEALDPRRASTPAIGVPGLRPRPRTAPAEALDPTMLHASPVPARRRRWPVALAATAVGVAVVVVVVAGRSGSRPAPTAIPVGAQVPEQTLADAAAVAVEVPAPDAAAPDRTAAVRIELHVTPANALITLDGESTPTSFELPRSDSSHRIVVTAKGYRDKVLELGAQRDQTIPIKLEKHRSQRGTQTTGPGLIGGKDL
jgi:serine/threonine-protein kinase